MKLKQSFVDVFSHPLLLSASIILDALFFFMFAFVTTPVGDVLTSHVIVFFSSLSRGLIGGWKILALICILYLAGFAVYVVFQAPAWWIAKKIVKQKVSFRKYFLKFLKVNVLWLILVAVNGIIDLFVSLNERISAQGSAGSIVLKVFLWAIVALAVLSYPNVRLKGMFSPGLRKIIFFLLISFIMFHLASIVPIPFYGISEILGKIVAAILMAPMLTIIRVFAINELK